jgi:hypothetical protein
MTLTRVVYSSKRGDLMSKFKAIIVDGLTHIRSNGKLLLLIYVPILLLFVVIAVVSRLTPGLEMAYFTRDITAIADIPFYAGLVSQVGVILWSATAAVCLFTTLMLRLQKRNLSAQRFLFQAGILTALLLLDDVFLFHDSVFTEYLHIRQRYVFLLYLVLILGFLLLNLQVILEREYWILGVAFLLFGASLFIDNVHLYKLEPFKALITKSRSTILEDAPKLAGIATWLLYFTRYAVVSLIPASSGFTYRGQSVSFGYRKSQVYDEG